MITYARQLSKPVRLDGPLWPRLEAEELLP
jgi:hypothetical protein